MFGSPGWGWHIETAVHVIRLILGGAFDRFPLVIGHLGEGLMSLFLRLDNMTPAMTKLLAADHVLFARERVLHGVRLQTTFLNLLLEVGVPRIMFSADHPYQSMAPARAFLGQSKMSADRTQTILRQHDTIWDQGHSALGDLLLW